MTFFYFILKLAIAPKLYTGNVRTALVSTIASNPLSFSFIAEFDRPRISETLGTPGRSRA
ncbi:hypothetical protein [Microcoleus sp. D2_18a_D3]|uniref:hypothetical protein n=1 Tax=Microcoleus sp. D2_18a_D3 TaxID=3055330 RepID=UPI002FCF0789